MSNTKRRRIRRPQVGAVPGTLVLDGGVSCSPVRVLTYDSAGFREDSITDLGRLEAHREPGKVTWYDHDDVPDKALLEHFRTMLTLHPLAVADVANVPQRPKIEPYEGFDFVVMRMFVPGEGAAESEQVSLFLGPTWVVTFQERPGDCLGPVRERIRAGTGIIRQQGADYLAYSIVDAIVDGYFPVAEKLGDRLETLEMEILQGSGPALVSRLHEVRRDLLALRRSVWPLREALAQMTREGFGRFQPNTRIFLRDAYDHCVQVIDLVENLRELASSLLELHLASIGFRTNEVMKVLTIISTIFLPLTFIAGVYGMNFDTSQPANMPELRWPFGYVFSLALMGGAAIGMLLFFRAKGWLGGRKKALIDEDEKLL